MDTYREKIKETLKWGGDQLLLQGGHHPELGLKYYVDTFKAIKAEFPDIRLHALGPPEVAHITKIEKSTHKEVLQALKPAIYAKGSDWKDRGGIPEAEQQVCDDLGIEVVYLDTVLNSSSALLKNWKSDKGNQ